MEVEDSGRDFVKDVMASIGWQNSFIPIISENNKLLLQEIRHQGDAKIERADAKQAHEKESVRVNYLLKTADDELNQNLKLLTAHKSQSSTEHHLFKLAEHDSSTFKQILKEARKTQRELIAKQEDLKRNSFLILFTVH